ncbi:MAG TPA: hypothetical protein VMJ75_18835 [Candidatus Acidoferrales bacterium]|nr:hypothetical protein [Candidatus Acidoferrales bacterium]
MWGASLFLITIVLVTETGRSALRAYTSQTFAQFAAQSPYSDIAVAWMAILALVLLMMMRQQRRVKTAFVVVREVRGPVSNPEEHELRAPKRRISLRFRLVRALARVVGRTIAVLSSARA